MNFQHKPRSTPRAFSMVELLAAVAIMGVIAFIAIPSVTKMRGDSERNLAIARTEALNIATVSFIQARGRTVAELEWNGAGTAAAKYNLIKSYLAFGEDTLTRYMPTGYTVNYTAASVNSMRKWSLKDPTGKDIFY